ncbi:hypothetical protein AB2B41_01990 [Marimonas sp. MJW-29]|uniref:Uncharacterized protein n=1 Tax=Sulfitobacter sediminis TaxID=3234186 RepID=A0ABV3RHH1_9RHOB
MGILSYVLSAIVFAMWAFSMFRTLFAMRRRASERTGKALPGPIDTLTEWGIWLRDPAYRSERRQLLFMMAAIIALSVLVSINLSAKT